METKIYGYLEDGDDVDFDSLIFYRSLEDLANNNTVMPKDKIYVYELVNIGAMKINPTFVPASKKVKK